MAHYVAELISFAEANPEDPESQRKCAQAILQLWERRSAFPGPDAPLAAFEPIVRALGRLDPARISWGYYEAYGARIEPNGTAKVSVVDLALELDRSMGGVIRYLLQEATDDAISAEQKWLDPQEPGAEETSVVGSLIEAMRLVTADSKAVDALRSVEDMQGVLAKIAENLRSRASA
jgi:hypothetical protein